MYTESVKSIGIGIAVDLSVKIGSQGVGVG